MKRVLMDTSIRAVLQPHPPDQSGRSWLTPAGFNLINFLSVAPSDHRGTGAMRLHTSQPRALPILRKKYTDQIGEILYINQEKYICTRNKSIRHYNLVEMALPKKCVQYNRRGQILYLGSYSLGAV